MNTRLVVKNSFCMFGISALAGCASLEPADDGVNGEYAGMRHELPAESQQRLSTDGQVKGAGADATIWHDARDWNNSAGKVCYVTCSDGIQNGNETGVDCGGVCAPCTVPSTCRENLALTATAAVNPSGGLVSPWDQSSMNNGVGENCQQWAWMRNDTSDAGWATLTWNSLQTVGSMFIDGEHATSPACGVPGRDIRTAEIQYMDANNNWIPAGEISGQENYMFVFPSPVQAKGLRIWNVLPSTGNGNSIIHEWYVWSGSNCPTPVPN